MSSEDENMRVKFSEDEWLEVEVQAAAVGMAPKDYLRELLKDAVDDIRSIDEARKTLH